MTEPALEPHVAFLRAINVSGKNHLPNGAGRSKLTIDWIERGLGVAGTARNWRTVGKLLEMAGG